MEPYDEFNDFDAMNCIDDYNRFEENCLDLDREFDDDYLEVELYE